MRDTKKFMGWKLGTVVLAAMLVGTLDILSAFIDYFLGTGKNPIDILPFIASGIFGKPALAGGTRMILTGLLCHYIIAGTFTFFFFWLYARMRFLSLNRILTGVLYGIFIWMVMTLIVVQLSNAPHTPVNGIKLPKALKSVLILIGMIGLPLSFIAYRYRHTTDSKVTSSLL